MIGFSGGADSALLLKVAHDELGARAVGVIALSESYPQAGDGRRACAGCVAGHPCHDRRGARTGKRELRVPIPTNRCYYCKAELFTHLSRVAGERGIRWIAYGANHDDLGDYRPGQTAAQEFGARAPLLEAGLTKAEIRHLSKSARPADLGQARAGLPVVAVPLRDAHHGGAAGALGRRRGLSAARPGFPPGTGAPPRHDCALGSGCR